MTLEPQVRFYNILRHISKLNTEITSFENNLFRLCIVAFYQFIAGLAYIYFICHFSQLTVFPLTVMLRTEIEEIEKIQADMDPEMYTI